MEKEVAAGISGRPQAKRSRRDDHKYKARLSGGEHTWTFSRGHVTLPESQGERAYVLSVAAVVVVVAQSDPEIPANPQSCITMLVVTANSSKREELHCACN